MKNLYTLLLAVFISSVSFAQEKDNGDNMEIIIKKTIINNGDTTIEEKRLTGAEASAFQQRHKMRKSNMKEMRKVRRDMDDLRKDYDVLKEHYVEKVIIHRSGEKKGTEELIEKNIESMGKSGQHNVIVRTISDDESDGDVDVEIGDGEIIIIRNGEKEVINLDDITNNVIHSVSTRNGKTKKRVILIEEEIEEDINEDDSKSGSTSPLKLDYYPNPSNGVFTLEFQLANKEKANLSITDINGKTIFEERVSGQGLQKKQVDIQQHGSGVYFISLEQGGEVLSYKVVVE